MRSRAAVVLGVALLTSALTSCGGSGSGSSGSGTCSVSWTCSSSQCASVMGGYSGTAGPFSDATACEHWRQTYILSSTCSCGGGTSGTNGGTDGGTDGGTGGGSSLSGPPTIGYLTPSAPPGTKLSIAGTNLPSTAAQGSVTICGVAATIASTSTSTILVVVVPSVNAGTCALTVTTALGSASDPSFSVLNAHVPSALVVDGSSVYWTEQEQGGSVKKVGVNGGPVTALATGLSEAMFIAQDATYVYWTEYGGGTVKKVAKAGGAVTTLATGLAEPFAIAVDGTSVYFTENLSTSLKKVSKTVTGPTTPTVLATDVSASNSIAVDGSGIYYYGPNHLLSKVGLAGGSGTALSTVNDQGVSIAIDASQVYWGYRDLYRVPLGGGTPAIHYNLSYGQYDALAVDNTNLYFTDGYGNVSAVPLAGGSAAVLAPTAGALLGLAADGTSVYWTDGVNALVKKVPRGGGGVSTIASSPNVP